ncbi:MAG TPA: hypothetical protein VK002_06175 [Rubricoccaceae bacterium]|nr:hypothetical protein [Rubricoccaceae bacterium]
MTPTETQYVTDEDGHRIAVLVGIERYRQLLDALEEIEAVRAYDEAKASGEGAIPFEQAVSDAR